VILLIILPSRIDICKVDIIPEHHFHYLLSSFLAMLFNQPSVLFKRSISHFYPALCKVIGPWLLFGLNSIFFYGFQEDSNTVINTGYKQRAIIGGKSYNRHGTHAIHQKNNIKVMCNPKSSTSLAYARGQIELHFFNNSDTGNYFYAITLRQLSIALQGLRPPSHPHHMHRPRQLIRIPFSEAK